MKNLLKNLISFTVVIGFLFLAFASSGSEDSSSSEPMTRTDSIHAQFSSWNGSHPALTKLIKDNMNDPKSYDHIETRFIDKGDYIYVIAKFRGTNAFGGVVINTVTANVDFRGNVIKIVSQN